MGYVDFIIAAVIISAVGFMVYMFRRWRAEGLQARIVARIVVRA